MENADQFLSGRHESDTLFNKIAEILPEAIVLHSEGRIVGINDQANALFAADSCDAVIGKRFLDFVHPDDRSLVRSRIQKLDKGEDVTPLREYRVIQCAGAEVYVEATATLIDYKGVPANLVVLRDITSRKLAKKKLIETNHQLRIEHQHRVKLAKSLIDLCERDRRDIAMELHDNIGQVLTTLNMDLEYVSDALQPGGEELNHRIQNVMNKTSQVLNDLRKICSGLLPSMIDNLGLIPSIQFLAKSVMASTNLRIHLFPETNLERFDKHAELTIYRIAQEGLTNVVKHAHASQVHINLVRKSDYILLSIEDDGVGFDASARLDDFESSGSLGLHIMMERAVQLNGEFTIESSPGQGTLLVAEIPVQPA